MHDSPEQPSLQKPSQKPSKSKADPLADAAALADLTNDEVLALYYDWTTWARPNQLPPDGDWTTWLLSAGRGFGKALSLDTHIPTDYGWTTMGEVSIGYVVFDENYQPCNVTFVSDIMIGRKCYDVVFSDGTVITADADHEWVTWTREESSKIEKSTVTTQKIKDTLLFSDESSNHFVDLTRYIVDVKDCDSVPVRCIQVDSASHLFLVSKSMIPTHNTRTGAEYIRMRVESGVGKRIALIARTVNDVRNVIVEGESGILAVSPPWFMPHYEPSKRRLTWPNGAIATTYTGDEPKSLRGPQHDTFWCDELAAYQYGSDTWDNLLMGLRLGDNPRGVVTTTPRNNALIRSLLADKTCHVTRGSSYDNMENLPETYFSQIIKRYAGTRLGRQELYAEILDDNEFALWRRIDIERTRLHEGQCPELKRIVVAVDPAITAQLGAETGIVVCGVADVKDEEHFYVLNDYSMHGTPNEWARAVIGAMRHWKADKVIGETNNGGDLVESNLRTVDQNVPFKGVTASRGKYIRAEPIAAMYEQGRVHHIGTFQDLEDQLCTWQPGDSSPDRLDALVWGITELSGGGGWVR